MVLWSYTLRNCLYPPELQWRISYKVCGSQLFLLTPLEASRTDAGFNLEHAIEFAARSGKDANVPLIPEVLISFGIFMHRAVTTQQYSATDFAAFRNTNGKPLVEFGGEGYEFVRVSRGDLHEPDNRYARVQPQLLADEEIFTLRGLNADDGPNPRMLAQLLPHLDAVIIPGELTPDQQVYQMLQEHPDVPVVYCGKKNIDEKWIRFPFTVSTDLIRAKLLYCLAKTQDLGRLKQLFEANLRGEYAGEVVSEMTVLGGPVDEHRLRRPRLR